MTNADEITKTIQPLLDAIKRDRFNDDYQATNEEAMGILLSNYFDWDGIAVLTAASHGLEDSNFHTLSAKVDRLITAENRAEKAAIRAQERALRNRKA
jgi:hypothetical protein